MDASNILAWTMLVPLGLGMWALVIGGIILGIKALIDEFRS